MWSGTGRRAWVLEYRLWSFGAGKYITFLPLQTAVLGIENLKT